MVGAVNTRQEVAMHQAMSINFTAPIRLAEEAVIVVTNPPIQADRMIRHLNLHHSLPRQQI